MIQEHTSTFNDSDTILDGRSRCLLWCKCQLRYTLKRPIFGFKTNNEIHEIQYSNLAPTMIMSLLMHGWLLVSISRWSAVYLPGWTHLNQPASFQQFNNYNFLHISMVQIKCRSMFTIFDYIVYNLVCRFNRSSVCSSVWLSYFVLISES